MLSHVTGTVALPLCHLSLVPSWNQSSARHSRGSPALSCEEGGTCQVLVGTEGFWSDVDVVPRSLRLSASPLTPFAVLSPPVGTDSGTETCCLIGMLETEPL